MQSENDHFRTWFDYDLYANAKVLSVIEANMGNIPDDTLKLFSHIIAAHHTWNTRINGSERQIKVWDRIPVSEMGNWLKKNLADTQALIDKMDETGEITYENTMGGRFSNQIPDIFFHVLTHSHYHRGQIARNMRENGIEPAETNYIVYRR